MQSLLAAESIDLGKTPASCSAICQSSDVSNFFKASKAALKQVTTKNYKDDILYQRIIKRLGNRFSTDKTKLIADGLCQIMHAHKNQCTGCERPVD